MPGAGVGFLRRGRPCPGSAPPPSRPPLRSRRGLVAVLLAAGILAPWIPVVLALSGAEGPLPDRPRPRAPLDTALLPRR